MQLLRNARLPLPPQIESCSALAKHGDAEGDGIPLQENSWKLRGFASRINAAINRTARMSFAVGASPYFRLVGATAQ
jgi:hypothetical protein